MKAGHTFVTNSWSAVERFFLTPSSARPLALWRILFGAFALVEMLCLRPHWQDLFGQEGLVHWVISKEIFASEGLPHLAQVASWLEPFGVSADETVLALGNVYLLALLALAFGFCTRSAALIAWLAHVTLWNTGSLFGYGIESFTRIGLFYCLFMPVSRHWALDARRESSSKEPSWGATLSYRVLQLHLCLVYLCSGLAKMQGDQWGTGEATWRVLGQPEYAQFDMSWLAQFPWLLVIMDWSVLVIELGYAFLIWPRKTRPFALTGILLLHAGIGLFMGLWGFAVVLILMNVAAWGHCTTFRRLSVSSSQKNLISVSSEKTWPWSRPATERQEVIPKCP